MLTTTTGNLETGFDNAGLTTLIVRPDTAVSSISNETDRLDLQSSESGSPCPKMLFFMKSTAGLENSGMTGSFFSC